MCGLVSVITKNSTGFNNDQREAFDMLLWIDTFRGDDSTGVFVVDNIGNVRLSKEATYAPRFMSSKEYGDLRQKMFSNGWAAVGHNRKATRGDITDENAHPFVVDDNIVLVHNGSYNGDHKELKDVEVDSLAIAHTISEGENLEESMRKINAAYALIWYNQEEKSLNFLRNMMRPLWMMESHNAWVFASEECFLQLIKAKFKIHAVKDPHEIKEYQLHTFKLGHSAGMVRLETRDLDISYYKHNTMGVQQHSFPVQGHRHPYEACGWEGDGDDAFGGMYQSPISVVQPAPKEVSLLRIENGQIVEPGTKAINEITKQVVETLKGKEFDTMNAVPMNKLMGALYNKCRTMKYRDYLALKEEIRDGHKIKVVINDITEADDQNQQNYLLLGQTIMNDKLYATFHVHETNFGKLVSSSTNDAVYEIEVNGISWKCTEGVEVKEKQKNNMQDWQGIVVVHGKNPVPIFMDSGKHAVH